MENNKINKPVIIFNIMVLLTISAITSAYSLFYPTNILIVIDWLCFICALLIATLIFTNASALKLTLYTAGWWVLVFYIVIFLIK